MLPDPPPDFEIGDQKMSEENVDTGFFALRFNLLQGSRNRYRCVCRHNIVTGSYASAELRSTHVSLQLTPQLACPLWSLALNSRNQVATV